MSRRPSASLIAIGTLFALAGTAVADDASSGLGRGLLAQADRQAPPEDQADATAVAAGGATVPAAELAEEGAPVRPPDLSYGVAARLRWVSVPGWLLNAFTKKNVPLSSWGTGIEFFRRKGNFDFILAFSYQDMSPSDGNWLGSGHNAMTDTNFVQFQNLALYGLDASFVWHTHFNRWAGLHYGAGFGLGIVGGHILRTVDTSGCTDANAGDVSQCHPVMCTATSCTDAQLQGSGRIVSSDVPSVLPIINVVLGFDFQIPKVPGLEVKLDGGFYDAFYLGGGVGYSY
jgi:hypothetical protein